MAAQNRNISGQNASGGKDGQEQENVRVAALFAARAKPEPQRAQGQGDFQTHQAGRTEYLEHSVKDDARAPFVGDPFAQRWREGEDIVPQKVSVLPH